MEYEGKVVKQIGALGFYARVRVHVTCQEIGQQPSSITLDASADDSWLRSNVWLDAAQAGAALGLKLAVRSAQYNITGVHGMPCDTNPTLVAIAAIRAVWSALAFEPDEALAGRIETAIIRRSEISVADLEGELDGTARGT
jgi:hypothetical protein